MFHIYRVTADCIETVNKEQSRGYDNVTENQLVCE